MKYPARRKEEQYCTKTAAASYAEAETT